MALAVLVARRPETLSRAQFFAEDGQVFFLGTYFGTPLEALLRPYNGYLHLVPRLVGALERSVPIALAPLIGNAVALTIVALIAAFLASDRMSPLLPDRRARLVAAAGFVLLPATHETLGSITFIQAYLVVLLVAVAFSSPPGRPLGRAIEATVVAVSGLSTPVVALLAPLQWIRIRRHGMGAVPSAATATVAGALRILVVTSGGVASGSAESGRIVDIVFLRLIVEPFRGAVWTSLASDLGAPTWLWIVVAAMLGGLVTVALRALDRSLAIQLILATAAVGGLGIVRSLDFAEGLLDPLLLQRYFLVAGWAAVVIVAAGLFDASRSVRRASLLLAAVLVVGMTADFRIPPQPDLGWSGRSSCIGRAAPCVVPVHPVETFSIRWPGLDGQYDQGDWTAGDDGS